MIKNKAENNIDYDLILYPLIFILGVCGLIGLNKDEIIYRIEGFVLSNFGWFYLLVGLSFFGILLILAFSPYGKIRIGGIKQEKEFSTLSWGAMIFTSTMSADLIYWSLSEWAYYYTYPSISFSETIFTNPISMAVTYPLYHWGVIPWSFYILPALSYAYLENNAKLNIEKISDACSVVLGGKKLKIIDIVAQIALISGVATAFSVSIPLLSSLIKRFLPINEQIIAIGILLTISLIYIYTTMKGIKAIEKLAKNSIYVFLLFLLVVLLNEDIYLLIGNSVDGIKNISGNFLKMSLNNTEFAKIWTIFYWAYWISWSVATPFFIAKISKGRSIREIVFGGLGFGILGTYLSITILGNLGLQKELSDLVKLKSYINIDSNYIIDIISNSKYSVILYFLLFLTMVLFYASTLNSISMISAEYTMKNRNNKKNKKNLEIFWSIGFIVVPIILIFKSSILELLKSLSIISAFPMGIILVLVVLAFLKTLLRGEKYEFRKNDI